MQGKVPSIYNKMNGQSESSNAGLTMWSKSTSHGCKAMRLYRKSTSNLRVKIAHNFKRTAPMNELFNICIGYLFFVHHFLIIYYIRYEQVMCLPPQQIIFYIIITVSIIKHNQWHRNHCNFARHPKQKITSWLQYFHSMRFSLQQHNFIGLHPNFLQTTWHYKNPLLYHSYRYMLIYQYECKHAIHLQVTSRQSSPYIPSSTTAIPKILITNQSILRYYNQNTCDRTFAL